MIIRELFRHLRLRGFVFNFSSQLVANVLSLLIAFVTVPYAARVLGTRGFGEYNLVLSFSSYAIIASSFGFSTFATREIPRLESISETVNFTITLRLILSVLSSAGLWFAARLLLAGSTEIQILAIIFGINTILLSFDLRWVFIGREQMWQSAYMGFFGQVVFCVLLFLFVHNETNLITYAWIQLSVLLVPVLLSTRRYISQYGRIQLSLVNSKLGELKHEVLPLGISALTATVNATFAGIIIGLCLSTSELGEYAAGYKLIMVMNTLYIVLATVAVPRVSRLFVKSRPDLIKFLRAYFGMCLISGVLGGGVFFLGAGTFVNILFGSQFSRTQILIEIWALGFVPLNGIEVFILSCLVPCNASKGYLISLLTGAAFLVASAPLAAFSIGLDGVPIAQALSELVMILVGAKILMGKLELSFGEAISFFDLRIAYREILAKQ